MWLYQENKINKTKQKQSCNLCLEDNNIVCGMAKCLQYRVDKWVEHTCVFIITCVSMKNRQSLLISPAYYLHSSLVNFQWARSNQVLSFQIYCHICMYCLPGLPFIRWTQMIRTSFDWGIFCQVYWVFYCCSRPRTNVVFMTHKQLTMYFLNDYYVSAMT